MKNTKIYSKELNQVICMSNPNRFNANECHYIKKLDHWLLLTHNIVYCIVTLLVDGFT